jgi:protein TonB
VGGGAPATTHVDVIAITLDDDLLEQVGRELDGQSGIRLADSVEAAAEHVEAAHAQVILLDARKYADPGSAVDALQALSDSAVVVVLAPESQSAEVASAVKRSAVFAVLPIPIETGKTAAVLEGARGEAIARAILAAPQAVPTADASQPTASGPSDAAPWPEPVAVAPPARPSTPRWLLPGMIGLLVLGIAAAWFLVDHSGGPIQANPLESADSTNALAGPRPAPVATTSVPGRVERGSIEELLDKAATAFRERRFVEPQSDCALLYFRSVLAQAPDNGEARQGLDRIASVLDQRLQSAINERRFDDAATAVTQFALVRPADPKIQSAEIRIVEGQIAESLDAGKLDRASQLLRQATQAQTLPADRATYLRDEINRRQRMQAAIAQQQAAKAAHAPVEPGAPPVETPPTPLAAAPQSSASGDVTASPRPIPEAERPTATRELGTQPAPTDVTEPRAVAARRPSPAPPSSAPARAPAVERTYYVAPAYPKAAEEKGISGEVQVRLTVGTNGRVKAAEVVSSTPSGVFDQSVMAAVIRWRFKAPQVDGRAVEATTVVSVVFKPADGARR